MPGAGIQIEVSDRQVRRALNRLALKLENMYPVMQEIGAAVQSEIDLAFREEREPDGTPWEPLSDVTLERRRGTSAQILSDTRVLANSITYNASRDQVEVGTNEEYAGTHQFGAAKGSYGSTRYGVPIPWGDIPARHFIPVDGLTPELNRQIYKIVEKYLSRLE